MRILSILLLLGTASAFLASGQVTLDSSTGFNNIGLNMLTGNITGIEGDLYYFEGKLWTNYAGGFRNEGKLGINEIKSCGTEGYTNTITPQTGNTYCIKLRDNSYGKIYITEKTSTKLVIEWAHQRDGTNSFTTNQESIITELNLNQWLIGIIIVLTLIIIIVLKLR